jgi:hypothetical protein
VAVGSKEIFARGSRRDAGARAGRARLSLAHRTRSQTDGDERARAALNLIARGLGSATLHVRDGAACPVESRLGEADLAGSNARTAFLLEVGKPRRDSGARLEQGYHRFTAARRGGGTPQKKSTDARGSIAP